MADVKIEPVTRDGERLVSGFMDHRGRELSETDYHTQRKAIMNMRDADPALGRLYDRYLDSKSGGGKGPHLEIADIKKLTDGLEQRKVPLSSIDNQIGRDLKAHGYDRSYRPDLVVNVNGKQMSGEVVVSHLKAAGVQGNIQVPRSEAPGKVSGGISFDSSEVGKVAPSAKDPTGWRMVKEELVGHSSRVSGVKGAGPGLMKLGAGLATGLAAGVAAAAEPDATPKSVALAAGDQAIPGFQAARQPDATLTKTLISIGDNYVPGFKSGREGQLCKAFGEVSGAAAQGGTYAMGAAVTTAAVAGGTVTTGVGGVALGAGMAVLTVKAGESANKLATAAGEASCESILEGGILLRQKAGQAMDSLSNKATELARDASSSVSKVKSALSLTN